MKFKREDGKFDIERFKAAVRIYITAQDILVDNACYPTKKLPRTPTSSAPWPRLCEPRLALHELRFAATQR